MLLKELLPAIAPQTDWSTCLNTLESEDASALLAHDALSHPEHLRAQQLVQDYFAAEGESAASIVAREQPQSRPLSIGLSGLDSALLGDGLHEGEIVEISGGKGVGKSLLSLITVLTVLRSDNTAAALLIDTEGSFSAERAYEILVRLAYPERRSDSQTTDSPTPRTREAALEQILARLHVTRRSTVPSVADALSSATTESEALVRLDIDAPMQSSTNRSQGCTLRIIVIDTFTTLYKDKLSSLATAQGHASMTALTRHLRAMAMSHAHPCLVLVRTRRFSSDGRVPLTSKQLINDSVSALPVAPLATFAGTKRKPALGSTLAHLTDWTIWLSADTEIGIEHLAVEEEVYRPKLVTVEVWRSRRQVHNASLDILTGHSSDQE